MKEKEKKETNSLKEGKLYPSKLRPSSLKVFAEECQFKWFVLTFMRLPGVSGARATLGSAIHLAIEDMWLKEKLNTIQTQEKIKTKAINYFISESQNSVFSFKEDVNSLTRVLTDNLDFILNTMKKLPVPEFVEKEILFDIPKNDLIYSIGGTIDYLRKDTIRDVKTTSGKIDGDSYKIQQSFYALLARKKFGKRIKNVYLDVFSIRDKVTYTPIKVNIDEDYVLYILNELGKKLKKYFSSKEKDKHIKIQDFFVPNFLADYCNFCPLSDICPAKTGDKNAKQKWEVLPQ